MEDIVVQHSDTQGTPFGYGSYGSRTSSVGSTAAVKAAGKIREKARRYAAHMLEALGRRHRGRRRRTTGSRARPTRSRRSRRSRSRSTSAFDAPEGMEPYLDETAYYDTPNCTWPFGTHIAIVEIDEETGAVDLTRYIAVDDVGNKINPMIVDGQLHGGIVQGVGQALWERAVYDDDGQLLSGTMMDYALPRGVLAARTRARRDRHAVAVNPLGVKGVGEAGAIASHGRGRQRRHRRPVPAGHPPPRHAVHRPDRVAGDPGCEGRPGMIPAAFEYDRPSSLDEALGLLVRARRLGQGDRRRAEPSAAPEAPARGGRAADRHRPPGRARGRPRLPMTAAPRSAALTTYREIVESPTAALRVLGEAVSRTSATSRSATAARSAARSRTPTRPPTCRRSAWRWTTRRSLRSTRGERVVPFDEFFQGAFETGRGTRRDPGVHQARPAARRTWVGAYAKLEQPASGYSIVGVAAVVGHAHGVLGSTSFDHVRVAITGVGDVAYRAKAVEDALIGTVCGQTEIAAAAKHATDGVTVSSDIHADREYRTAMAEVYVRRALEAARAAGLR